jgi:hypothetical protein
LHHNFKKLFHILSHGEILQIMKTAHSPSVKATAALRVCTDADDVAYQSARRQRADQRKHVQTNLKLKTETPHRTPSLNLNQSWLGMGEFEMVMDRMTSDIKQPNTTI